MNKLIALFLALSLSACASTTVPVVTLQGRTDLGLTPSPPLLIDTVQFKVVEQNGVLVVVMGLQDFDKLSSDMEAMQDRLQLDLDIIKAQEQYYTAPTGK